MSEEVRLSRAQVREFDRRAIEELGLPGAVLMENAGRQAAERLLGALRAASLAGRRPGPPWRVAVVCGPGNNGGDGWVLARHALNAGCVVETYSFGGRGRAADAELHRSVAERLGLAPLELDAPGALAVAEASWAQCDALVDGLLGTGAVGAPKPGAAAVIEAMNRAARPLKLALDLPSGLDCDLGSAAGACFRADLTVSFVGRKSGFDASGAAEFTGVVALADIGITPWALRSRAV